MLSGRTCAPWRKRSDTTEVGGIPGGCRARSCCTSSGSRRSNAGNYEKGCFCNCHEYTAAERRNEAVRERRALSSPKDYYILFPASLEAQCIPTGILWSPVLFSARTEWQHKALWHYLPSWERVRDYYLSRICQQVKLIATSLWYQLATGKQPSTAASASQSWGRTLCSHPEFVFQTMWWLNDDFGVCEELKVHSCCPLSQNAHCSFEIFKAET